MRAIAAGLSDVGLQREHNEDSFVVLKEYDLFVVADGMGGHRAGDVASKHRDRDHLRVLPVDGERGRHLAVPLRHEPERGGEPPAHGHPRRQPPDLRAVDPLARVPRHGHDGRRRDVQPAKAADVHRPRRRLALLPRARAGKSSCSRATTRSSTTTCSRCPTSPTSRRASCPKNVITRALGMQDQVVVDLQHDDPHAGRRLRPLLRRPVRHGAATTRSSRSSPAPPTSARPAASSSQRANEHGGEDNITAVLIKIEEHRRGADRRDPAARGDRKDARRRDGRREQARADRRDAARPGTLTASVLDRRRAQRLSRAPRMVKAIFAVLGGFCVYVMATLSYVGHRAPDGDRERLHPAAE